MDAATVELILWALLVAVLLGVLNALQRYGVIDPVIVTHVDVPQLLVATQAGATNSRLEVTASMAELAASAARRGLTEEEGTSGAHPARGFLYGEFGGVLRGDALTASSSTHGVILDTGDERVTTTARDAWRSRLTADHGAVDVKIVRPGTALIVTTDERDGRVARAVASWRLLRRLKRRAKKLSTRANPPVVVFASPRNRQISFAVMSSTPLPDAQRHVVQSEQPVSGLEQPIIEGGFFNHVNERGEDSKDE